MLRPTIGGVGRDVLERARAEEELLIDGQSVATSDSFSDRRSPSFDDASRAGFVMPQTGVCDAAERPKKNRAEAEKKETPLSDIRSSDEVDAAVLQDRAPDLFRRSVRKADSSPASPPPPNDRHLPASGHASGQAGTDKTLPTSATARKYSRRYSIFTEVQLHYEKQPPLVDSRMFDNTYCVVMMKEAVLYFGKDYLMRTQFMLSYVIVNIVILLAIALISLFASSTMPAAAVLAAKKFFPLAYSWRHFSEANCVAILMTVGVSVVIIVALTFADFANYEPLYFRQALASQALGIQSDLQSMVSQDMTNEKDIARRTSGRDRKEDSAKEVEDDELVRKMVHRDHVRRKLMLRSKTIDHVQHLIAAMDLLYPIKILGMRADWGHMSGIVAILASAAAGIWRATSQ
jgi:hypothetical protein